MSSIAMLLASLLAAVVAAGTDDVHLIQGHGPVREHHGRKRTSHTHGSQARVLTEDHQPTRPDGNPIRDSAGPTKAKQTSTGPLGKILTNARDSKAAAPRPRSKMLKAGDVIAMMGKLREAANHIYEDKRSLQNWIQTIAMQTVDTIAPDGDHAVHNAVELASLAIEKLSNMTDVDAQTFHDARAKALLTIAGDIEAMAEEKAKHAPNADWKSHLSLLTSVTNSNLSLLAQEFRQAAKIAYHSDNANGMSAMSSRLHDEASATEKARLALQEMAVGDAKKALPVVLKAAAEAIKKDHSEVTLKQWIQDVGAMAADTIEAGSRDHAKRAAEAASSAIAELSKMTNVNKKKFKAARSDAMLALAHTAEMLTEGRPAIAPLKAHLLALAEEYRKASK